MGRESGASCVRDGPGSKDLEDSMLFESPAAAPGWFKAGLDADGIDPTKLGWIRFLLLRFATSLLMTSPPPLMPLTPPKPVCDDCGADDVAATRDGEGGGVIREAAASGA
jgi:hypothetical protein